MASVNKVIIDFGRLRQLYIQELQSIPVIGKELGISQGRTKEEAWLA